jgi:hypothetical protein
LRIDRRYAVAVAAAAAMLGVAVASSWIGVRRERLHDGEARAEQASSDIREVLELRARRDRASLEVQADANLTAALRAALAATGAGDRALASVATEAGGAPSRADRAGFVVRRSTVRLKGMRLDELGRFLAQWRTSQPLFVVVSVDLVRAAQPRGQASSPSSSPVSGAWGAGGDERFDATVVLGTVVVSRKGASGRGA